MVRRFHKGPEDKPTWRSLPLPLRSAVESVLKEKVVSARRVWGGYGPSATLRLKLADGRAVLFKGVRQSDSSVMRSAIRREMRVYQELPGIRPWAPALLGAVEMDGWQLMLLEFVPDVKGTSPWTPRYVKAALAGLAGMHSAFSGKRLPDWLPSVSDTLLEPATSPAGWRSFVKDPEAMPRLAALAGEVEDEAAFWLEGHLPRLIELEAGISSPRAPTTLLHMDVRSDNLLFRKDGSIVLVDWPLASSGPGVVDCTEFLITVAAEGGPAPELALPWYAAASDSPVSNDDLIASVAAASGYFASRAWQPDIPGVPRVRPWQRAQLVVALRWLARLVDIPEPCWLDAIRTEPPVLNGGGLR